MRTVLRYDRSFNGFLSAVFMIYEENLKEVAIVKNDLAMENFFDTFQDVLTDETKAERVLTALKKKCSSEGLIRLYKAFLSELPEIENSMLDYIRLAFSVKNEIDKNFSHPSVLKLSKVAKMVSREKHRMDAFIRFRLTKEDIYFATIAPDFNVLPLNEKHFRKRYADQKWIIYDIKRGYGLFYDLNKVISIEIELDKHVNSSLYNEVFFTSEELQMEELWKNYFKSTNIETRRNMRLHVKHVPKRYWKYLSEKQILSKN